MGRKLAGAAPPWPAAAGNTTDAVDVSLGGGAAGLGGREEGGLYRQLVGQMVGQSEPDTSPGVLK